MELKTLVERFYTTEVILYAPDESGVTKGETVKIHYHPIDSALLAKVQAASADESKDFADAAALLVKSLPDITRDGVPVECNLELFKSMDARHPAAIVKAVMDHFRARG